MDKLSTVGDVLSIRVYGKKHSLEEEDALRLAAPIDGEMVSLNAAAVAAAVLCCCCGFASTTVWLAATTSVLLPGGDDIGIFSSIVFKVILVSNRLFIKHSDTAASRATADCANRRKLRLRGSSPLC